MKALLPLLIIQLFGVSLNIPAKELPLYGEVEINKNENIFLKADLFKIGKRIELIINFCFENVEAPNPSIYVDYCFSDQNEDYTCLTQLDSYYKFDYEEKTPVNTTIRYDDIFLTIDEKKYNYLLLRVRIDKDYVPFSLKIVHNPNSGINGKYLYGYYQEINIDEKECFYYDTDDALENKRDELKVEVTFNSKDKYESLIIYYDNLNYNNEEFTEILNKNITTDSMKKENDKYTFYFYLPLYNFTKNYVEYKYLVFRPQNVGNNVTISGMWSDRVGKKVPTYGTLVVENIKDGLFYLNIENLEKWDNIYLQFIVDNYNFNYLDISYLFCDENYNEMFGKVDHREDFENKKEKDGIIIFYVSVEIEKKAKYFLFQLSTYNLGPKITIKHTEKNEYTNTTLNIIIVILIVIAIIFVAIVILFILRNRKNKVTSSDIENVSSLNA